MKRDISQIPASKIDNDDKRAQKLKIFREKVTGAGRSVKLWDNPDQLAGQVVTTMNTAMNRYSMPGWIRGDQQPSVQVLSESIELRKENEALKEKIREMQPTVLHDQIAGLDDDFEITYKYQVSIRSSKQSGSRKLSFGEILQIVGHNYRTPQTVIGLDNLKSSLKNNADYLSFQIEHSTIREIITHFEILGILKSKNLPLTTGGSALFYQLTEIGLSEYLKRMVIKKAI